MFKKGRKRYTFGIIFILLLISAGAFVGNYFHEYALSIYIDKSKISAQDKDDTIDEMFDINSKWFDENRIVVNQKSVTGVNLVGNIFENPKGEHSNKWVIVTHGYTSNARKMSNYIKSFYDLGYNVFAPDLIAHGESGGETISMGGYDSRDMRQWIAMLSEKYNTPDIVLFGISMGAATVMNTLDENLPINVKVFIEDSGYLSLTEEFSYQLQKLFKLPSFPIIPLASLMTNIRAGYSFDDVNATNALKNTTLPGLILHGGADGFVPTENAQRIYQLLSSEKDIHIFDNAKHVKAEKLYRIEYWEIIRNFLNKYF